jgi:hypothetical protein
MPSDASICIVLTFHDPCPLTHGEGNTSAIGPKGVPALHLSDHSRPPGHFFVSDLTPTGRVGLESGLEGDPTGITGRTECRQRGTGNVFEPIPEQNRVSEGWDETNTALWQAAFIGGTALVSSAELAYALLRRSR